MAGRPGAGLSARPLLAARGRHPDFDRARLLGTPVACDPLSPDPDLAGRRDDRDRPGACGGRHAAASRRGAIAIRGWRWRPGQVGRDSARTSPSWWSGSRAEGVPYRDWLSVGKIVAWQLRRVIPQRMFHVEVQARAGWTLEQMHQKLAELPRPPDAVILYAGHNEFASRYGWSDSVPYYEDDPPVRGPSVSRRRSARRCPCVDGWPRRRCASGSPPARRSSIAPWSTSPRVPPSQYEERLTDFRRRMEVMLADLRQAGVLTILIVPPGNDSGFEPSRSILPPQTPRRPRRLHQGDVPRPRTMEGLDPRSSVGLYRDLIAEQPGFAEAHFRLARLLEREGEWDEAYREYVMARDLRRPSDALSRPGSRTSTGNSLPPMVDPGGRPGRHARPRSPGPARRSPVQRRDAPFALRPCISGGGRARRAEGATCLRLAAECARADD